jgi:2-amino-4-hydroxy-6-hydroxymethyldihydropteridine diphosphokinase
VRQVFLSLGSNLGDRLAALQSAVDKLHSPDLLIRKVSGVYETAPVDFKEQPDFLNIVVQAQTSLFPMRLLHRSQRIELEMGRRRTVPKGPRPIDIDILLHGSAVVKTGKLKIPHPRMEERRFVLEPMAELAPELRHPVTRQTMLELLAAAPHQFVRRTALAIRLPGSGAEERS